MATSSQQPHEEAPVASSTQRDDPLNPSTGGGGVLATSSCRPFRPPRSEIGPTPQSNVEGNQCQRIDEEEVNPLANGVDSIDDHIDKSVEESNARNSRGRRNAKPWIVDVIEADGTIKPSNMTMAQAMKPLHGTKVVFQFDTFMEPIGDSGGLLSGETFYFDYQNETIKGDMLKSLGKFWKEAKNKLFHDYYDPRKTLEQNVNARPKGIDEDHWRRFLRYRLRPDTKEKCSKPIKAAINPHRRFEKHGTSRQQGRDVSRGEVLGKEHQGRVRGMGFRPTPNQLFGRNSQLTGEGAQAQETQRALEDLRAELAAEKLKRQAVESEVASKKVKRQAMENALRYLIQKQGGNLPADIIAGINFLEGQS
ncbi:hypothetical protein PIB30_020029 [Stylosanthes scabra]|uniref:Uncharacterized protein n=1 Tax=Stylosanthes scabra TaxID=79078 RepID=A0ABU6R8X5_9FABA|nr:hypothetical protein [Stylosanthes scabra]